MGEDGRAGRRRRRPGAGAGPAARGGTELEAPVDVFLPRYRSVPVPPSALTEPALEIDDPDLRRRGATIAVSIVDVAADGYRLRLVDVPAAFDRDALLRPPRRPVAVRRVLSRGPGGPASGRAAARRPPRARLAYGPRPARARPRRRGPRPVPRPHGRRRHAPQPRLPRLDRARGHGPARAARGRPARGRQPRRHRPPAHRHRAVRDREHGLARLRPRGAHARVRHGPRRRPARQGQPVRRDPQRHRPRRVGPVQRPGARRAVLARCPGREGGLPARPADAQRVRPRRRRRRARDDRADGPAEGLRPAGRRDAGRCWRPGRGSWSRAAATRPSPIRSGPSRPRTRRGSR